MSKKITRKGSNSFAKRSNKSLSFRWLFKSKSNKILIIEEIVDKILNAGVMIHEKGFRKIMSENKYQKSSIIKFKKEVSPPSKNKFLTNDY